MIDERLLEQIHRTFCETVAELRDETMPMIVILKPEEILGLLVPGDGEAIVAALIDLATGDVYDETFTDGAIALVVQSIAWVVPVSALGDDESPRALGEAGDQRATSIASTLYCESDGDLVWLAGRSTEYDPKTGALGVDESPEIELGGRIGLALAAATRLIVTRNSL